MNSPSYSAHPQDEPPTNLSPDHSYFIYFISTVAISTSDLPSSVEK